MLVSRLDKLLTSDYYPGQLRNSAQLVRLKRKSVVRASVGPSVRSSVCLSVCLSVCVSVLFRLVLVHSQLN